MQFPRVSVVILNWNGWKDTLECLESLMHLDYPNYKIIVCDNASTDGSMSEMLDWADGKKSFDLVPNPRLKRLTPHREITSIDYQHLTREILKDSSAQAFITFIETGGNLGFAGGNNVGLDYALEHEADYCWLLNNDTVVEPDALTEMVKHSETLKAKGVKNTCGSVQCFYDDPNIIQALGGFSFNRWSAISSETLGRFLRKDSEINHDEYINRLDGIHGCSWLLPANFLQDIGLMEERYFLYYEEIDWCLRSEGKYALTYAQNAYVYHKEGSSIGYKKGKKLSVMSEFYANRNKFWLADKFFPESKPTIALAILIQAAKKFLRGQAALGWMQVQIALGKRSL